MQNSNPFPGVQNNLVSFQYDGKLRIGKIERKTDKVVTLKIEGENKPYKSFSNEKIKGYKVIG